MILANFMDSSLLDLKAKGLLEDVPDLYNPNRFFNEVLHFTPHKKDLSLQRFFSDWNIEIIYHPANGLSIRNCFFSLLKIQRLFIDRKVDIVRGRLPYLGSLLGCIAARRCKIPAIVSLGGDNRMGQIRNNSYLYGSRQISFGMENLVLRLCDRIIVPNHFTESYVGKLIGKQRAARKCVRIPWRIRPLEPLARLHAPQSRQGETAGAANESELRPKFLKGQALQPLGRRNLQFCSSASPDIRKIFDLPKDAALIPIIGFLNHYKYTDVIYNALDRFFDKETDLARVVFIFCGDGPLRSPGERRFAVNNNVRFWGWQPRAVIQALLCESSLVVVPMSGFVLIEAASAGIPVVTSAIEWHSEFVENGVSGLVVPPEKCDAWRLAIAWLLRNSHKANVMGMRLKQKYLNDYSPADLKKREIDLYLNVAADVGNTRKARRLFRSPGTSQKE